MTVPKKSKKKTVMIALSKINHKIFVRKGLNQARIAIFGKMLDSDMELEPIRVTQEGFAEAGRFVLIDGRHRFETYEQRGIKEIPCIIVHVKDEVDLIEKAFAANVDGALP